MLEIVLQRNITGVAAWNITWYYAFGDGGIAPTAGPAGKGQGDRWHIQSAVCTVYTAFAHLCSIRSVMCDGSITVCWYGFEHPQQPSLEHPRQPSRLHVLCRVLGAMHLADPLTIEAGQTITLTTRDDVEAHDMVLPVTYPQLHNMCQAGGEPVGRGMRRIVFQ